MPDPTSPQPLPPPKPTWLQRSLTISAIRLLRRFRPRHSCVLFLTRRTCVKYSSLLHLSEATAMRFIASTTSIPVPTVHYAFERKGITYIVMSRIDGAQIGWNWGARTEESKRRVLEHLKAYIQEMRALSPVSSGKVEGVDGGKVYDMRISGGVRGFGPFESVGDFHSFITDDFKASPTQFPEINELLAMYGGSKYTTCFTHGDLSCANILVKGDKVVGIVDWDTSGWYPEYWEYMSAWTVNPYFMFWQDEVAKFLKEYPEAPRMKEIRQIFFGDA